MSSSSKIAFIGLGNMGAPMALNLLRAGHQLSVYDLSASALQVVREAGASIADSAAAAVQAADIVISMLPASRHVEQLYLGSAVGSSTEVPGILSQIAEHALIIDCSTIAALTSQKIALAAQARGLAMLDAPVSGGTLGAAAGTLTFIVGGSASDLERARPVLAAMGKNIFHAGGNGAGQTAKICNNMLLGILMAGTAEALALGVANGLDPQVLSDIMSKSSGRNWALEQYNPYPGVMENVPAARGYSGGFGVDLMHKDLGLATEAALSAQATIPLGELARNLYAMHSKNGAGAEDFSSILKLFQNTAK
ncbi:3-hydroxyisobutyrate dehydrogenase [Undibacterium sp.]|uniref:3-hydroxyisobutyrate dehydrogenase n=1 Tax=Undibacterium sp. TaxID=1914977 RepID=UPI0025F04794|nr:3-hydroxyisobutyrate dehydrogenase [Undibacterium sp.]